MPYPLIRDATTNLDAEFSAGFIAPPGYIDGLQLDALSVGGILKVRAGSCYIPSLGYAVNAPSDFNFSFSGFSAGWAHCYAYVSSGALTAELSTTAPTRYSGSGTGYTKTGDTSRRYLGSIYLTDGFGRYQKFKQTGNYIRWLTPAIGLVTSGIATTWKTVNPVSAGASPVTATLLDIRGLNSDPSVAVQLANADGGTNVLVAISASSSVYLTMPLDDTNHSFEYQFASSPSVNVTMTGLGYTIER